MGIGGWVALKRNNIQVGPEFVDFWSDSTTFELGERSTCVVSGISEFPVLLYFQKCGTIF